MKHGDYTKLSERVADEQGLDRELPWLQLLPPGAGSGIVVLKNGAFLTAFDVELVPWECVPDDELERRSNDLASVLRTLPEGCELQIEVLRRGVEKMRVPRCTSENPAVQAIEQSRRRFLSQALTRRVLENTVTIFLCWNPDRREVGKLGFISQVLWPRLVIRHFREREHRVALKDFQGHMGDLQTGMRAAGLTVHPLSDQELIMRLRQATNPGDEASTSQVLPWQYVSDRVGLSDIVVGVTHLQVGAKYVRVLSHKSYPDVVTPYCLREMARLPFECRLILGVEVSNQTIELETQQNRHKYSFAWTRRTGAGGGPVVEDKGAAAKARAHDRVLDALLQGQRLLPVAFNLVLWADDEDVLSKMTREAQSIWAQVMKGSDLLAEGVPGYEVFRSTLPGNLGASGRKRRFLSPKVADMASGLFAGQASRGMCGRTTFWGREGELVPFSLFDTSDRDQLARNALIFAQMGGGKSMLLGNIILGELAHDVMVRIIDVGGSTALVSELVGGITQRFSLVAGDKTDVVNPCDVAELSDDSMAFLLNFLTALLTKGDDGLDLADEGRMVDVLRKIYQENQRPILSDIEAALLRHKEPSMRQLGTRMAIATRGPYARILNQRSTKRLDESDVVYYDFQDCANDDRLTRILMACVTHDVLNMAHRVGPTRPKVLAMDESWRLGSTKAGARLMVLAGRTARKLRMSFTSVSQSLGDWLSTELRDAVLNNADIQFILKCPREDFKELGRVFKLNEAEIGRIKSLKTRKGEFAESFCIRPGRRQVLRLRVPPEHYWILTSDPPDREARDIAFEKGRKDERGNWIPFDSKWDAILWLAHRYPQGVEAAGAMDEEQHQDELLREAA